MSDALDKIARASAALIMERAAAAGYEFRVERSIFYRSDVMDLEGQIANWLESHVRKAP